MVLRIAYREDTRSELRSGLMSDDISSTANHPETCSWLLYNKLTYICLSFLKILYIYMYVCVCDQCTDHIPYSSLSYH